MPSLLLHLSHSLRRIIHPIHLDVRIYKCKYGGNTSLLYKINDPRCQVLNYFQSYKDKYIQKQTIEPIGMEHGYSLKIIRSPCCGAILTWTIS